MEKFCEVCLIIIIVLLIYLVFRGESFIQSVTDTRRTREFNFKPDAHGWSQADYYLQSKLNQ